MKRGTILLACALALTVEATESVAKTPYNDDDNQLFTFGYSAASDHGLDTSVITLPSQPVGNGFKGGGWAAACANEGQVGPDCE